MTQPVNGMPGAGGKNSTGTKPVGSNQTFNGNYAAAGFNPFAPMQMKTLVYSPDVRIVIETQNGTQYDVSKDIIRGTIVRKENSVSSMFVTLANKPAQKGGGPRYNTLFDRMDKIICYCKRTEWITVFTGYLDSVPFAQMYAGMCEIKASCTLKRLIHTWWNPALPESMKFFSSFGFAGGNYGVNGSMQSPAGIAADAGLGNMLADILNEVGGWSAQDILIQNFPMQFLTFLENNYQQIEQKNQQQVLQFRQMLLGGDDVSGGAGYGGASYQSPVGTAASLPGPTGTGQPFYLSEIVAATDQRSMGPSAQNLATAQDLTKIGQLGVAAGGRDSEAWQAMQTYPGQINQVTAQTSDAAILAVACAMAMTGMMNFANANAPESLNYPNDGPNPTAIGNGCGLFQLVPSEGWGTIANEMNPRLAAGMFLDHLSSIDWRNMDPAAAIAGVQNRYPSTFYQPFVLAATAAVLAYRQAQSGAGSTTGLGGMATGGATGLPPIGGAGLGPTSAPASGGLNSPQIPSGLVPVPDASGAIAYGVSHSGAPYLWGAKGPGTFDCLVDGTLITTARGDIPIEKLTSDDWVLTSQGYRRVLMSWKVRDDARVVSLTTNGRTLIGTPDHRVWTENRGWVKLAEIKSFDTLALCPTNAFHGCVKTAEKPSWASQLKNTVAADVSRLLTATPKEEKTEAARQSDASTSKVWLTTVIPTPTSHHTAPTSKGRERLFTLPSGNITTVLSHEDVRSITPITTLSTTIQETLSPWKFRSTDEKARQRGGYMITSAPGAASPSKLIEHRQANDDSAVDSTTRSIRISADGQRRAVYDVMVEGVHEFFANGILVHNCSGFVSACYASIGVNVPSFTNAIAAMPGRVYNSSLIQPGDLIVSPAMDHVVMATSPGGGTIIECTTPGGVQQRAQYYNLNACTVVHICGASGNPAAPFNPAATADNNGHPANTPLGTSSTGYTGSATSGVGMGGSSEPIARNLFSYFFDPGAFATRTADLFVGEKAFIDDQPLIQMIQAVCKAGLRNFASAPTGEFVAYYPDWFGLDGKKAVLQLEDIECKDVRVNYSDDPLTTHVYVAGDWTGMGESQGDEGWLDTCGVVTVEDQWLYQRLSSIAPSTTGTMDAGTLLNRFGVRPYATEYTLAGSHALEFLIAAHIFMLKWAEQYQTTVQFTWMPELFPGMRINLANHNLQVYVTEVTHCLRGSERFLTKTGTKSLAECAGTNQMVLDTQGKWTPAEIKAFGKQELYRIVLSRYRVKKEIFATANHRWFRSKKRTRLDPRMMVELTTEELSPGDTLKSVYTAWNHLRHTHISPVGVQAGIVFGDGTVHKAQNTGLVRLFGEKDAQLLRWFPPEIFPATTGIHPEGNHVSFTEIHGLPKYFKDKPPITESSSYLYGWLAGYFAADGAINKAMGARLTSACLDHVELARDICHLLGVRTTGIRVDQASRRLPNGSIVDGKAYHLHLDIDDLPEEFFLIESHRLRAEEIRSRWALGRRKIQEWKVESVEPTGVVEEVFCAVVPQGHAFVLEDNILTGNSFDFEGGFSTSAQIMAPSASNADQKVTGNSTSNPASGAATAAPNGNFVSSL